MVEITKTLERPVWNPSLYTEVVDENNIILLDEFDYRVLTGTLYVTLLEHLDQADGLMDLCKRTGSAASMPEIMYALQRLQALGHVVEGKYKMPRNQASFYAALGTDAIQKVENAASLAVSFEQVGDHETLNGKLSNALTDAGLIVGESEDARLHIVVTDDYMRPELGEINRQALAENKSWMLIKPFGNRIWVGPIFEPGETGCWECLAQRLECNRQIESYLQSKNGAREPLKTSVTAFQPVIATAFNLAAMEAAKYFASSSYSRVTGKVLTLDTLNLETASHVLIKRPQCPACGDPSVAKRVLDAVQFESAKKQFVSDGGHRAVNPHETYTVYKHHVSNITGVVSWLEELTGDVTNGMTFSYSAGHNFALMGKSLNFLIHNLRGRSGGKGATDIQARVSAICEAIERYSGVYRGDELTQVHSYDDLGPEKAILPNDLMTFSEIQYRERNRRNQTSDSEYHVIPEAFDTSREISWTPVWSLTEQRQKFIPSAYCYYGHPDLHKYFFCPCDANGAAAGNTLAEAAVQGFMELVERDSVALWWYNRVQRPAVNLASFNDAYFDRLPGVYQDINRDIWVLDITSDLGIPAFAAVSSRTDQAEEDIILGFGAHFDARLAIMRALTEVNQFLPVVSDTDPEGRTIYKFHDVEAIHWWKTATIESEPYVAPATGIHEKTADDYVDQSSTDLKSDIERCVAVAKRNGLETLVLNQTQPDIGLSVVKIFVPGLRHFWKRFGPGRLYDTPVKLGWCSEPTPEEDLNPTGIFF